MPDWQALIHCFDDADLLDGALASLPDAVQVHVVDGRYATFAGGRDITPDAPAVCDRHPNVVYHRPPNECLPWGHRHADAAGERWPQYREMRYSLSVLDAETWTLKLDTDERLRRFDVDLGRLKPDRQVYATVHVDESPYKMLPDDRIWVARLWMPTHWSAWTDDVLLPRDRVPRDARAPAMRAAVGRGDNLRRIDLTHRDDIVIDNIGHERPADYRQRRADQLDTMYPYAAEPAASPHD